MFFLKNTAVVTLSNAWEVCGEQESMSVVPSIYERIHSWSMEHVEDALSITRKDSSWQQPVPERNYSSTTFFSFIRFFQIYPTPPNGKRHLAQTQEFSKLQNSGAVSYNPSINNWIYCLSQAFDSAAITLKSWNNNNSLQTTVKTLIKKNRSVIKYEEELIMKKIKIKQWKKTFWIQTRSMYGNLIFSSIFENSKTLIKDFMKTRLKLPLDTIHHITCHHNLDLTHHPDLLHQSGRFQARRAQSKAKEKNVNSRGK